MPHPAGRCAGGYRGLKQNRTISILPGMDAAAPCLVFMLKTIRPPVPNAWHRGTQVFNLGRGLRLFFRHGLLGQARAGEGRRGRQAMELQFAILHGGLHAIAQLQAAGDDLLAQRVLHLALDGAA